MSRLIVMVGNIGSGKTTLSRQLVKQGCIIVSKDSIRYMIGSGNYVYRPDCEPVITEATLEVLRVILNRLDCRKDYNVVIDNTNMSRAIRKEYIDLARRYGYETQAILLPRLPMEESVIRRLSSNHGTVSRERWEEVYKRRESKYEKPTLEEGFDIVLEL